MASSPTAVTFPTAALTLKYSLRFKGGTLHAFLDLQSSVDFPQLISH